MDDTNEKTAADIELERLRAADPAGDFFIAAFRGFEGVFQTPSLAIWRRFSQERRDVDKLDVAGHNLVVQCMKFPDRDALRLAEAKTPTLMAKLGIAIADYVGSYEEATIRK